jgi:aryl-alcohol dehydrogenase-like predicted oxidoreductase
MHYAPFGKSGFSISRLSLGCMSLPAEEKSATQIIHLALDSGINYFDTADIYADGLNETIVGKALRNRRNDVVIASKVGNVRRADGGLDWNPSKKHILKSIDGTLSRLGTNFVDVYQLHGGTIQDNFEDTVEAFEQLKKDGKIRCYGISSVRPNVIRRYIEQSSITSEMIQYSVLDRRPEEECLEWLKEADIAVLARGSLAQGMLINKPAQPYLGLDEKQVKNARNAVHALTKEGRNATHVALRYVLQNPAITSAVVGIRNEEQIRDVLGTIDSEPLSPAEIAGLRGAVSEIRYLEHRVDQ